MKKSFIPFWQLSVISLVLSFALCLGGCYKKKQPEEGDSCDSYNDAFCLNEHSPDLMWCEDRSYYRLYNCNDICADDGKTWNGECSHSESIGHDVCWCTSTGPSGVQVNGFDLWMQNGEKSPDPMPTPTTYGDEPVINGYTATKTGDTSFRIELDVTSIYPVTKVHLEMNGEHYIADIEPQGTGEPGDIDACQILADVTGITCTQACVDACTCAECSDPTIQRNAEQSCAVGCSTSYAQGQICSGCAFRDEIDAADKLYNGYDSVPGLLDSMPCDGSVCAALNVPPPIWIPFDFADSGFPDGWETTSLQAESPAPESRQSISNPYNPPPGQMNHDVKSCF